MIVLLSSKLPECISQDEMLTSLSTLFPAKGNNIYFKSKTSEKNDEGSRESLYALIILSKALPLLPTKVDMSRLIFKRDKGGKPYFDHSNIKFNVSHSKGYVACCVSDECDVGIDIEASYITPEKARKLAKRFFTSEEAAKIEQCPESFARIWSEKEAEAKFTGKDLCILLNEQKSDQAQPKSEAEICFHRFKTNNIPITVCTPSHFSTILFKIIQ